MKVTTRSSSSGNFIRACLLIFVLCAASGLHGQTVPVVSPFEGSVHWAEYEVEFDRLGLADAGDANKVYSVEGRLVSNIYSKPESKTNLEVLRSYERELRAKGFNILSSESGRARTLLWKLYGYDAPNDLRSRKYKSKVDDLIAGYPALLSQSDYYLAAKRSGQGKTIYVSIVLKNPSGLPKYRNMYLVDVLEVADMEVGTVRITEELLTTKIDADGKYIIYSIYFDTGKAEILPDSKSTLETMAAYLRKNSSRQFYIVGHTDDTGTFLNNMSLSERRADAVVRALQNQYAIGSGQIEAKGVGPLAPLATNETDDGRQLNRRVELVLKLASR